MDHDCHLSPEDSCDCVKQSAFHKEKSQALLTLLENAHAEQYTGLDDDMADNCNEWIGGLTEEEVADIVVAVYRTGL